MSVDFALETEQMVEDTENYKNNLYSPAAHEMMNSFDSCLEEDLLEPVGKEQPN